MATLEIDELASTIDRTKYDIQGTIISNHNLLVDNVKTSTGEYLVRDKKLQTTSTYRSLQKKYLSVTGDAIVYVEQNSCRLIPQMMVKLYAKSDAPVFFVNHGLNGEPNNTHDWNIFPIVQYPAMLKNDQFAPTAPYDEMSRAWGYSQDLSFWNREVARHKGGDKATNPQAQTGSTTYSYNSTYDEYVRGFTNPGNYDETDRNSTPIQTAVVEYVTKLDDVKKNDFVIFTLAIASSGDDYTWYLNRCVNASTAGHYERGVSYTYVEEVDGTYATVEKGDYGFQITV